MTFDIPLRDTSSAGLGITLKGKTSIVDEQSMDMGIFVKSILTGGAAYRVSSTSSPSPSSPFDLGYSTPSERSNPGDQWILTGQSLELGSGEYLARRCAQRNPSWLHQDLHLTSGQSSIRRVFDSRGLETRSRNRSVTCLTISSERWEWTGLDELRPIGESKDSVARHQWVIDSRREGKRIEGLSESNKHVESELRSANPPLPSRERITLNEKRQWQDEVYSQYELFSSISSRKSRWTIQWKVSARCQEVSQLGDGQSIASLWAFFSANRLNIACSILVLIHSNARLPFDRASRRNVVSINSRINRCCIGNNNRFTKTERKANEVSPRQWKVHRDFYPSMKNSIVYKSEVNGSCATLH